MKKMADQVKGAYGMIEAFFSDFDKLSDVVACLLEDVQIQQALDMQDELDRRNIALYGVSNNYQNKKFDFSLSLKESLKQTENPLPEIEGQKRIFPAASQYDAFINRNNIVSLDK